MKTIHLISFVVFAIGFGAAQSQSHAQVKPDVRLGLYTNGGSFSVGGGVAVPVQVASFGKLVINPMVEYLFVSGATSFFGHADVAYEFDLPKSPIAPWAGAGLGIGFSTVSFTVPDARGGSTTQSQSSTNAGLNIFAGVGFPTGSITPYAQAKLLISSGTNFQISGGVRF